MKRKNHECQVPIQYQEPGERVGLSQRNGDVGKHDAVGNGDRDHVGLAGAHELVFDGPLRLIGHRHEVGHDVLLPVFHKLQITKVGKQHPTVLVYKYPCSNV